MSRRGGREVAEVLDAPVERAVPVARPVERVEAGTRVVYVPVPVVPPAAPEAERLVVRERSSFALLMVAVAALVAAVSIAVWVANGPPRLVDASPDRRGQQVQSERGGR